LKILRLTVAFLIMTILIMSIGCGQAVVVTENRTATIVTSMGTIKLELYEKRAPITTANFIGLAQDGFYDGLIFHRVIDDFMIQGGDPLGNGTGGSGKTIAREIHEELKHIDGAISMARSSNPDSASSQFFICDGAQTFLDDSYAVFGVIIDGIDVVKVIAAVSTNASDKPDSDVVMTSVTIE
jgi:cyclophilin family peptidyl-prolyl cis-trans isomerase